MSQELMKDPYVKDLLIKLDVLKNALKDERKKTSSLESKNKELESFIIKKDNELRNINNAMEEIKLQIENEKKKLENKEQGGLKKLFSKKEMQTPERNLEEELKEEVTKLQMGKENIFNRLSEALQQCENFKLSYKVLIEKQKKRIEELNKNNEDLKLKNKEIENNTIQEQLNFKDISKSNDHFNEIIKNLELEKNEALLKVNGMNDKLNHMITQKNEMKKIINQNDEKNVKLALKLAEYKKFMIDINIKTQVFHGIKIGKKSKNEIDLTLGLSDDKKYAMKFSTSTKEFIINVLDVEYIKKIGNDQVQIAYMLKSEKRQMTVQINEAIIDQLIQAYNDFYAKSMKVSNKLEL